MCNSFGRRAVPDLARFEKDLAPISRNDVCLEELYADTRSSKSKSNFDITTVRS